MSRRWFVIPLNPEETLEPTKYFVERRFCTSFSLLERSVSRGFHKAAKTPLLFKIRLNSNSVSCVLGQ